MWGDYIGLGTRGNDGVEGEEEVGGFGEVSNAIDAPHLRGVGRRELIRMGVRGGEILQWRRMYLKL